MVFGCIEIFDDVPEDILTFHGCFMEVCIKVCDSEIDLNSLVCIEDSQVTYHLFVTFRGIWGRVWCFSV